MKTRIAIALLATTLAGAAGPALAACGPYRHGPGAGPGFREGGGPGGRLERMAAELGLTQEQKSQIGALLQAERDQAGPLFEKLRETRGQLRAAARADNFDEAGFRALVQTAAGLKADLAVSRVKTRQQIDGILTAEQREQGRKLRAEHRPGPRGRHFSQGGE